MLSHGYGFSKRRKNMNRTAEHKRLDEARLNKNPWKKWGPYLSERQWGTVREDYSESGDAWNYFSHDQARSRAYRWGEDGLSQEFQTTNSCSVLALPFGTAMTPFSRRGYSGSPTAREIMVRMSRMPSL